MENSFLRECATNLMDKWGDDISKLTILLPTRRAITFFKKELTLLLKDRAVWQPKFVSIGDIMSQISSIRAVQPIVLLSELYKVYSKYYDETFDKFYYWGNIILADFSTIDNYCCDAELLFSNISDLSEIDAKFDYLSEEQKGMILRFWHSLSSEVGATGSQSEFLSLWNNLFPIYTQFKERLLSKGIGYSGMIYRNSAELLKIKDSRDKILDADYAIIGFNALSRSEEALFETLKEGGRTQFFWDYDNYYIDNKEQEAGLFIRKNLEKFKQEQTKESKDNFIKRKKITITDAPSEVLGCKWVGQRVKELLESGQEAEQSAIILTNEDVLIPLLYSIPTQVENINVTSGYPLNLSSAFILFETLCRIQQTSLLGKVYYKEFLRVVNHPYTFQILSSEEIEICNNIKELIESNFINYIPSEELMASKTLSLLFAIHHNYTSFSTSIIELFTLLALNNEDSLEVEQLECINKLLEQISIAKTIIESGEIELSLPLFIQLVKKHLMASKITLEGEPLKGLQIMGILESRNIDFKNLFILSLSEDNYPSVKSVNSIIPTNLREGYGLPTVANHEAMYSYYFYRLLQRAENIELVYSSYAAENSSGEASRYLHQLLIESPHKDNIIRNSLSLNIVSEQEKPLTIEKKGVILDKLQEYQKGKRSLSASRLYEYVECPLRFYFHSIEQLEQPAQISDELDAAMAGNVMHRTLERIFTPNQSGLGRAKQALDSGNIQELVTKEIEEELKMKADEFNGRIKAKRIEICRGVESILRYEVSQNIEFTTIECEHKIKSEIELEDGSKVCFKGSIDRLDALPNGLIRIIDYKSGKSTSGSKSKLVCKSLPPILDSLSNERARPIFQTLLYSLFVSQKFGGDITPHLYFARDITNDGYSSQLAINGETLYRFSAVQEEFTKLLKTTLQELFNADITFFATDNKDECKYCYYRNICNK